MIWRFIMLFILSSQKHLAPIWSYDQGLVKHSESTNQCTYTTVVLARSVNNYHTQAWASNFGKTTNAMDKGAIDIGEFAAMDAGFKGGISPSSVSFKGVPLSSTFRLRWFPSCAVRWYSSLISESSDALLPTQETVFLRPWTKVPSLWMPPPSPISKLRSFLTVTMNSVDLLRFIRSRETPAC